MAQYHISGIRQYVDFHEKPTLPQKEGAIFDVLLATQVKNCTRRSGVEYLMVGVDRL